MCPNCFHSYNWRKIWFKKTDLWICVQTRQTNHVCFNVKEILRLPTSWPMKEVNPSLISRLDGLVNGFQRPKVVTFINHQKPHVSSQGDWRFWCSLLSKCWSPISKNHPRYHQYSHYFACFSLEMKKKVARKNGGKRLFPGYFEKDDSTTCDRNQR